MDYDLLAKTYDELESISGKLKKTEIIAELLRKTPAEDMSMIVLLLEGRVFPSSSEAVIGVASQLIIKAIAKAYGVSDKEVVKSFTSSGDLGLTAEHFSKSKKQKTLASKKLRVEKVFENIQKIASQEGKGSQEKKTDLIAELLTQASPKEAKYVTRTVLEDLRVGVAEGLVRDAIASAFGIEKSIVENAWQMNPDYGEIAKIAKKKGEAGLKAVELEIGKPITVLLAEKSPSLKEAIESFEKFVLEFKYDGMRTQIHKKGDKVWIFTRRLEDVTNAFPDLAEYCKKAIKAKDAILDGETLAIDPKSGRPQPFQHLSTRIRRKYDIKETIKEIPIQVNFFDIIYADGKTYFNVPLEKRFEELKKVITPITGKVRFVDRLETKNLKEAEAFYNKALSAGQEGLIVKNLEGKYVPGRRVAGGWLKVKPTMENLDLVIIGGTWGTGKRTGWIGSLNLGCRDASTGKFLECGMLGTGLKEKKTEEDDVTLADITKLLKPLIEKQSGNSIQIKPKIVIEVGYEEIQKSPTYSSGWALRFPRFIRLRDDKGPDESDTKGRIEYLYKIQKGKK